METKEIRITNCPVCAGSHSYSLNIEREQVFGLITNLDAMKEKTRVIEVLLTCPSKDVPFKAKIKLSESASNKIKGVKEVEEKNDDEK